MLLFFSTLGLCVLILVCRRAKNKGRAASLRYQKFVRPPWKSLRENNKWELKLILNKALKRPRHRVPAGHSVAPQLCKRLHFLRWQTNFHKSCSINFERQQCKATTSYFAPQLCCRRRRSVCFATRVYHCGLNVSLAQGNLLFGAHLMWRHFVKLLGPEFLGLKERNSPLYDIFCITTFLCKHVLIIKLEIILGLMQSCLVICRF